MLKYVDEKALDPDLHKNNQLTTKTDIPTMDGNETIIEVKGLYKKFCRSLKRSMFYGSFDIMRNMLGIPYEQGVLRKSEFWALENVNFSLKKGETLGIIGTNGSGKSTLLRLISGIFPPDKGSITINGRIGSLIAVGAGFHPHMTGRENIFLNGTILGMSKKDIKERFDSIVDFADIGNFLDAPVSTYSSGMRVRLGFAIAVHSDPDILLVDEILSVGDLSFRNKSLRYMATLREKARGIIFISHNLEQVRVLCNRVIILDKGRIIYDGPTHEGCVQYQEMTREIRLDCVNKEINSAISATSEKFRERQSSGEEIEIIDIGITDINNKKINKIGMKESFNIFCAFEAKKDLEGLYFTAVIVSSDDYKPLIYLVSNDDYKTDFKNIKKGKYRINITIPEHHLIPSVYVLNFAIRNEKTGETYERIFSNVGFRVESDGHYLERGVVAVKENWKLIAE